MCAVDAMRFNFNLIRPNTILSQVVKHILVIEDGSSADALHAKHILPFFADGSPGIVFQENTQPLISNNNVMNSLFLYGQSVKPVTFHTQGPLKMIVYVFHAHVLKALFRLDAHALTDTCMDLSLEQPAAQMNLKDQLLNAGNVSRQISLLDRYLLKLAEISGLRFDPAVQFAADLMFKKPGLVSTGDVLEHVNFSERTFERKFLQHVGVTPRLYVRICRFQAALNQLTENPQVKLTDIAYGHGYADQSHFNRTFKEFTGHTPTDYRAQFCG